MVENNNQTECMQWGSIEDNGKVFLRDLFITRDDKRYSISVTTEDYLKILKKENMNYSDLDIADKAYILNDINSLEETCRELSLTPFENLKSFLFEQEE